MPQRSLIVFKGVLVAPKTPLSGSPSASVSPASSSCARWHGEWRFSNTRERANGGGNMFTYVCHDWHPACRGYAMALEAHADPAPLRRGGEAAVSLDAAVASPVFFGYSNAPQLPLTSLRQPQDEDAPVLFECADLRERQHWGGSFSMKSKNGAIVNVPENFTLCFGARISFGEHGEVITLPDSSNEHNITGNSELKSPDTASTAASSSASSSLSSNTLPVVGEGCNMYGKFVLEGTFDRTTHFIVLKRRYLPKRRARPSPTARVTRAEPVITERRASKRARVANKVDKDLGAADFRRTHRVRDVDRDVDGTVSGGRTASGSGSSAANSCAGSAGGGSGGFSGSGSGLNTGKGLSGTDVLDALDCPLPLSVSASPTRMNRHVSDDRDGPGAVRGRHRASGSGGGTAADDTSKDFAADALAEDAEDDAVHWFDAHAAGCAETYEGEYRHGARSGWGTCVRANGLMYEGEWVDGHENGVGVLSDSSGHILYEGEFQDGHFSGQGTYYYKRSPLDPPLGTRGCGHCDAQSRSSTVSDYGSTGQRSKRGGMKKTKKADVAIAATPSSDFRTGVNAPPTQYEPFEYYEGEWKESMRHGYGTYVTPNGDTYTGEWRVNNRCGRGRLSCADGSWFEGDWLDDARHGHGMLGLANNFYYEGAFKDDRMEGRGWCIYPNGSRYEGMWRAGRKDGRGTLKFTNGACYEGRFRDDRMDGTGTLTMSHSCVTYDDGANSGKEAQPGKKGGKRGRAAKPGKRDKEWVALIPIEFQSDVQRMHLRAGFDQAGM